MARNFRSDSCQHTYVADIGTIWRFPSLICTASSHNGAQPGRETHSIRQAHVCLPTTVGYVCVGLTWNKACCILSIGVKTSLHRHASTEQRGAYGKVIVDNPPDDILEIEADTGEKKPKDCCLTWVTLPFFKYQTEHFSASHKTVASRAEPPVAPTTN